MVGIGKTIRGISTANYYHSDASQFFKRISDVFKVNLTVNYCNYGTDPDNWILDQKNDYGYEQTYKMTVSLDSDQKEYKHQSYELFVPVDWPNEQVLNLEFYFNGIVYFHFLTYDHAWQFLVDGLAERYDFSEIKQKDYISDILKTKIGIESVMKILGLKQLLVFAGIDYQFFDKLVYTEDIQKIDFNEVLNLAQKLDNLKLFNLDYLVHGIRYPGFPEEFLKLPAFEMAILQDLT